MVSDVQGKVVCITGAAGGIGTAIARAFAEEGAHLALLDQKAKELTELAHLLQRYHGGIEPIVANLDTEQAVQQAIHQACATFNHHVDILIANVGVLLAAPFEQITTQVMNYSLTMNLLTHYWAAQAVVPLMKTAKQGAIIFVGSDQGLQPDAGLAPYAVAKAGLHCLTKVLAREMACFGIHVNAVAPGMTRTPLVTALMEGYAQEFGTPRAEAERFELQRRGVPLARLGEPEEVAQAVMFAATATYCTGSIFNVSGGNVKSIAS